MPSPLLNIPPDLRKRIDTRVIRTDKHPIPSPTSTDCTFYSACDEYSLLQRSLSASSGENDSTDSPPSYTNDKEQFGLQENAKSPRLPEPFCPPSLISIKDGIEDRPRSLPGALNLPHLPRKGPNTAVDAQDRNTPDSWVARDPRLVRLTGKHPFNSEAKLRDLYAEGFFTPTNLFYVRNHGAVPKVDQEDARIWPLHIHGLCANPVVLTLQDLHTRFPVVTLPITMVCAGNRRKEQNVVQKSLGFSWGAGGVSTALFTGVYLADVLDYVRPAKWAKHVIFEGSDQLPNGPYGTSQRLSRARNRQEGMLLCWAMNGLALEPDHGFPLRLVVPGQIGGRSVKWLSRIELSDSESQHHLHFHDNKVLPMPVGPDQARAEKHWWYDPRYIINDLNVNSAIACPDHDEVVDIPPGSLESTYKVKGYAYAGGGRRITRVEVSLDGGCTWVLANIEYPEDSFRELAHSDLIYGEIDLTQRDTCFCWCFWDLEVRLDSLKSSNSLTVRAMDESMALQPRDMYWNATGMMNNWWFRVAIHKEDGGSKLRFEHPTMAGTQPGGWMQRMKDAGLDPTQPVFGHEPSRVDTGQNIKAPDPTASMIKPGINRKITVEELKLHSTEAEPWFVVNGQVYDGTGFLKDHPGGSQSITLVAAQDASEDFMAIHSSDAKKQLADFHIGQLEGSLPTEEAARADDGSGQFLSPNIWKKVKLVSVESISRDTRIFRFELHGTDQELGLPVGQHVYVRLRRKASGKEEGEVVQRELVQRAYTPVSRQGDKGFIDLLIKIYYPTSQFPMGGRMTLGFSELEPGDSIEMKGPIGHFVWKGNGIALLHGREQRVREIGLVCGGSGITPILQVLRGILHDASHDDTQTFILDVNRYFEDILCREELDQLLEKHKSRCRLHYTLTGKPVPEDWKYSTGRINNEMLRLHLPEFGKDKIVCICGPPAMERSVTDALGEMGWEPSTQIVIF